MNSYRPWIRAVVVVRGKKSPRGVEERQNRVGGGGRSVINVSDQSPAVSEEGEKVSIRGGDSEDGSNNTGFISSPGVRDAGSLVQDTPTDHDRH